MFSDQAFEWLRDLTENSNRARRGVRAVEEVNVLSS